MTYEGVFRIRSRVTVQLGLKRPIQSVLAVSEVRITLLNPFENKRKKPRVGASCRFGNG